MLYMYSELWGHLSHWDQKGHLWHPQSGQTFKVGLFLVISGISFLYYNPQINIFVLKFGLRSIIVQNGILKTNKHLFSKFYTLV